MVLTVPAKQQLPAKQVTDKPAPKLVEVLGGVFKGAAVFGLALSLVRIKMHGTEGRRPCAAFVWQRRHYRQRLGLPVFFSCSNTKLLKLGAPSVCAQMLGRVMPAEAARSGGRAGGFHGGGMSRSYGGGARSYSGGGSRGYSGGGGGYSGPSYRSGGMGVTVMPRPYFSPL